MLKITSFLLKNRKNRPELKVLPPDSYASGNWELRPKIPILALSRYKFFAAHLIIAATFV